MHPLDNVCWHALTGPQANVAQGDALARRFLPDVGAFAALPDEPTPAAWDALARLLGPGAVATLFRADVEAPPGWEELFRFPTRQMIAGAEVEHSAGAGQLQLVPLGPADVPEMIDLVQRTRPGPFQTRTIELGTYLGIRDESTLVAMAGERMKPPGHAEIDAVCTAASHRGRGFARLLTGALVDAIRTRGDAPFLHVLEENLGAIRLYEQMGFTTRRRVVAVAVHAPAQG